MESLSSAQRSPSSSPALVNTTVWPSITAYVRVLSEHRLADAVRPDEHDVGGLLRKSSVISASTAARSHCSRRPIECSVA